jgi:uncharacterized protein (DUF952 family)
MTILHITEQSAWQVAQTAGEYTAPSLTHEGFIHFSTPAQVLQVAQRFYAALNDLVLLEVDPALLHAELRYEESEPGMLFPHLYGPLNLDAVRAVHVFTRNAAGQFQLPTLISEA